MRTRWSGGLAVFVILAALPQANAQTPEIQAALETELAEAKPAPKGGDKAEAKPRIVPVIDYLDLVFLASNRPVLVRLHIRNGGRPYSAAWDDFMKKFFDHFDRNGDGVLDKAEAERAPNTQFLQNHLQGAIGFPLQGQTVRMPQIDTDKDGKVSRAEFVDYYSRGGFRTLAFNNNSTASNTDQVTNVLLKHLDANKDGKLSAEELVKAPAALQRLDLDEDEMISSAELTPSNVASGVAGPSVSGFLEIKAGAVDGAAKQVLGHYDKDKNGKLSRDEIGLDKVLFDRLDANHDGQLDAKEVAGFFRRDADLELMSRIGKLQQKENRIVSLLRGLGVPTLQVLRAEVFNPGNRAMPLAAKVHRHDDAALGFGLGDARIDLSVADQAFVQFRNVKNFYKQRFKQADTKKKGVVDLKQAQTAQFLDQIFPLADRDGDSKLTEKELDAYLDMQAEGAGSRLQLSITDEGRSLFDLLDEDGDGRLSVRELRTAWSRMKSLAKNESGLSREDVPRHLQVSVGQAQRRLRAPQDAGGKPAKAMSRSSAPLWFTKMDRNHDGDLSMREFFGSAEDFRKLDADGDGLISVEEARQFEARLAKEKDTKR
ncbi:MAG TPA: EF-hand domain-containing protein [Gemmataceae bacterium]|jgi:Ca2+-binding EF-hand superfamily protein